MDISALFRIVDIRNCRLIYYCFSNYIITTDLQLHIDISTMASSKEESREMGNKGFGIGCEPLQRNSIKVTRSGQESAAEWR